MKAVVGAVTAGAAVSAPVTVVVAIMAGGAEGLASRGERENGGKDGTLLPSFGRSARTVETSGRGTSTGVGSLMALSTGSCVSCGMAVVVVAEGGGIRESNRSISAGSVIADGTMLTKLFSDPTVVGMAGVVEGVGGGTVDAVMGDGSSLSGVLLGGALKVVKSGAISVLVILVCGGVAMGLSALRFAAGAVFVIDSGLMSSCLAAFERVRTISVYVCGMFLLFACCMRLCGM